MLVGNGLVFGIIMFYSGGLFFILVNGVQVWQQFVVNQGQIVVSSVNSVNSLQSNYLYSEQIVVLYVMGFYWIDCWSVLFGLCQDNMNFFIIGNVCNVSNGSIIWVLQIKDFSYNYLLLVVLLVFSVIDVVKLKLVVSQIIGWFNYDVYVFNIMISQNIDGLVIVIQGNLDIKLCELINFDVLVEWYLFNFSLVLLVVFNKKIKNEIYIFFSQGILFYNGVICVVLIIQLVNVFSLCINGVELSYVQSLLGWISLVL